MKKYTVSSIDNNFPNENGKVDLIIGEYNDNTSALIAGLTAGQIYSLPYTDGIKRLAEVIFPALRLLFLNISDADTLIDGSSYNVIDWNTHFDNTFSSVEIIGNEVYLRGGSNISINPYTFSPAFSTSGTSLIHIIDDAGCIVEVNENSFSYCIDLETVSLPNCVNITSVIDTKNNYGAFQNCSSLTNLYFPKLTNIGSYAFMNCTSISELTENNLTNVKTINENAFSNNNIDKISLTFCTYIGDFAFSSSTKQQLIINLPLLTNLGNSSFTGSNFTTIKLPSLITTDYHTFDGCSLLTTVILPSAVTIGPYSFFNCSLLTTVIIPSAVTIGSYAFQNCLQLTKLNLPSADTIGNNIITGCNVGFTSITLPQVVNLGAYSFSSSPLTKVYLPIVENIEQAAFAYSSIININLTNVKTISNNVFQNCSALTSVRLPNVKTISNNVFQNCSALTELYLPLCTELGQSVLNNSVFQGIIGATISLTIPLSIMTCNSGSPDGDIQYLQTNNNETIITV